MCFLEKILDIFWGNPKSSKLNSKVSNWHFRFWKLERRIKMKKKDYKGRCLKKTSTKSEEPIKTYNPIQYAYANVLEQNDNITEIKSNVLLTGVENNMYTTDFFCTKANGDFMVRECVQRKHLTKPLTVKLLDVSRTYWNKRGVTDWGIVIDEE